MSAVETVPVGVYMKEGVVYRVQNARTSGRPYAKMLRTEPTVGWVYEPGMIHRLALADRITMEQAQAFGARFGVCAICGRLLTDPESIDRGIGPVCANRI